MKKVSRSGFAVAETFLIVVILGILGFTGWYIWHSKQVTDKTLNDAARSSLATVQKAKTTTFAECQKAAGSKIQTTYPAQCVTKDGKTFTDTSQQYLVIKEWGVKLPLTNDLIDAYYVYKADRDVVYLSKSTYAGTNCAADAITLGALSRFGSDAKDPDTGVPMLTEHASAVKVGIYYYYYTHPQAGCDMGKANSTASFDSAKAAITSAQMGEFSTAAAKIIAAE